MKQWHKHDGESIMPLNVDYDDMIEVETWSSRGSYIAKATDINWKLVKVWAYYNLESFAKKLAENQQPLGSEFQKVLNDNLWELYER